MKKLSFMLVIAFALLACSLQTPAAPIITSSPIPLTSTSQPTITLQVPTQIQPSLTPAIAATSTSSIACKLIAGEDSTIYQRPSAAADVFGTLAAGDSVQPAVKTSDGFYGFDPGVAQAGNVGIFRNRWILKTFQVSMEGDCANLPIVIGPIANLCYAMFMNNASIFTSPDSSSSEITTLTSGDYAMAVGSSADWVNVDLNVSNRNIAAIGWVKLENIGYNGNCEALP